tara:strand:- start:172 stop:750 length:579 start_codon:yes stop_codon:yes gene_type:complete
MSIRKKELDLFSTPVSLYDLSDLNLESIAEYVESVDKEEFHLLDIGKSDYKLNPHFLNHPDLLELKESIENCIDDYSIRMGITPLKISGSWSNITDVGGRLELHRHECSIVSGVFYPQVNIPVTPLLLKNPIWQYKMSEEYDFTIQSQYPSFFDLIHISSGMLVLFPSWLEHKTDKEIGRRLCISFNTNIDK